MNWTILDKYLFDDRPSLHAKYLDMYKNMEYRNLDGSEQLEY